MKTILQNQTPCPLSVVGLLLLAMLSGPISSPGQGTAFTYQGRLNSGSAAYTGDAEFQPTLWDAASGGIQVAAPTPNSSTVAVSNGLFVLPLDFGAAPFSSGSNRWLQLEVRTALGPFTILTPRQPLTASPYAMSARQLSGSLPTAQLSGAVPSANLAGTYSSAVTFDNAANHFSGDGAGLTSLNAAELSDGTLPDARLSANVARADQVWRLNGNAGTAAGSHFLGTTDAQSIEFRVNNERVVKLEFNPGATEVSSPSPNFIAGHPGNQVAPDVNGATIGGGGGSNWWGTTPLHRVNGHFSTIAGGVGNEVLGVVSTIAGGERGFIGSNAYNSFIGGGAWNGMDGPDSVIAGGRGNRIEINAGNSVIGGGANNVIQSNAAYATIPGGYGNRAAATGSFAAGQNAYAMHNGAFVWADSNPGAFASSAPNQFSVRASGGTRFVGGGNFSVDGNVGIGTATPAARLHVSGDSRLVGNVQIGANEGDYRHVRLGGGNSAGFLYGSFPALADGIHMSYNHYYNSGGAGQVVNAGGATSRLTVGYGFVGLYVGAVNSAPGTQRLLANSSGVTVNGTFNNSSDRNLKQDFAAVDSLKVLDQVARLPITQWSYKDDPATRHIGPTAQDFHAAFQIGTDDKHIAPLDEAGVALAAIQGLHRKMEQKETEIAELKKTVNELKALVQAMSLTTSVWEHCALPATLSLAHQGAIEQPVSP